jgi:SAM-dependent methyltransferase
VTEDDRVRWDRRYAKIGPASADVAQPPPLLAPYEHLFPTSGRALDLACGQGVGSVWLARRGLDVVGLDVFAVAIEHARDVARRSGVVDRCRFDVVDLDDGLPAGPPVDVVLCHRFRDRRLDAAIVHRLAAGGLLAMTALSEVGGRPGPFRATPGELPAAFAALDVLAAGEGDGEAWIVARARRAHVQPEATTPLACWP